MKVVTCSLTSSRFMVNHVMLSFWTDNTFYHSLVLRMGTFEEFLTYLHLFLFSVQCKLWGEGLNASLNTIWILFHRFSGSLHPISIWVSHELENCDALCYAGIMWQANTPLNTILMSFHRFSGLLNSISKWISSYLRTCGYKKECYTSDHCLKKEVKCPNLCYCEDVCQVLHVILVFLYVCLSLKWEVNW